MKLLVTGASGAIGKHLIPDLSHRYSIRVAGRDTSKLRKLFPTVECVDIDDVASCFLDIHAVLHLAARNNDVGGTLEEFEEDNVWSTERLANAAGAAGVSHFIFISSMRAIEPLLNDFYGLSKLRAEKSLLNRSDLKVSVLRLAAVETGTFRGKLSVLKALPSFLRSPTLTIINALRPSVKVEHISKSIISILDSGKERTLTISDRQMGNPVYSFSKRTLDLVGSLALLLVVGWIMLPVALIILVLDGSPVIFRQERLGKDKVPFVLYKFRSMRLGTPELATHEVASVQVTLIGRVIRATKLDELPQLLNILKGELSLVGPRPCLRTQSDLISEREARGVYDAVPGLSGLAQVEGIDMSAPVALAEIDSEYLARRSILLDVRIMFRTIGKLFKKAP